MSVNRSPLRAIRAKRIDCSGGNKAEVRRCPCQTCSLWPFRGGRRLPKEIVAGEGGDQKNAPTVAFEDAVCDSEEGRA